MGFFYRPRYEEYEQTPSGIQRTSRSVGGETLVGRLLATIGCTCSLVVALGMWGCPTYFVWQQGLDGKAQLQKAQYNRQVQIVEADAKMKAAIDLAQAEINRAKGVAQANQIIGQSLKNNEAYLRWLWIEGLMSEKSQHQVIYIPTEAGLPILEAGRLLRTKGESSP